MYRVRIDHRTSHEATSTITETPETRSLEFALRLGDALDHPECQSDPELKKWVGACLLSAAPFPIALTVGGQE